MFSLVVVYRPDFSKFDPSLDPELDDDSGVRHKVVALPSRKAPPPSEWYCTCTLM